MCTSLGGSQLFSVELLNKPENWELIEMAECYYVVVCFVHDSFLALQELTEFDNKSSFIEM